ncbi:conserved hypothetical protein [Pediculus humanus corporis]|uniref:Uncharacterized protein n=1 Tax=Pediculus humanus subsp. corporis TaxID=121224 RepID=E0VVY9_PEDHC|nr:uncharacterized protein Phum_PHUM471790 [Pediculus humanus corporis]EEB17545.1 conserved hypothetical protein [Pediculus humanus corporis]
MADGKEWKCQVIILEHNFKRIKSNSRRGTKCWECNSERDYNCRDPFNFTHFPLVDCDRKSAHNTYLQSYSVCRKIVHRVNGEAHVERSCAWEQAYDNNRPCSSARSTSYSTVEHCSTCNTDACNDGLVIKPGFSSLPMTLMAYLGAKYI